MPPPNDARNTSVKKVLEKRVDLAPKLARKKSQDFTTKIQGWNQAGGGVLQKQDEIVVVEEPGSGVPVAEEKDIDDIVQIVVETESTTLDAEAAGEPTAVPTLGALHSPATPEDATAKTSAAKKGRDIDLSRGAWVRRKSKPQVETPPVKHAGTPKKRVVSDGHWRRDRPTKEETPPVLQEKDLTPKPIVIRRSVINVGLKVPPSHQDFSESPSEAEPEPVRVRPLRHPRSRSGSRSGEGREATPDYETSGTRVYIKRRRRSRQFEQGNRDARKSESSLTAPSSIDKPSSSTDITTPSNTPPNEATKRPVSEPRHTLKSTRSRESTSRPKSARQLFEAEDAPKINSSSRRRTPLEDDERRIRLSNSAEAFAKKITEQIRKPATPPAAATTPKMYSNRIEGWLANMAADPFTDSQDSSLTPEPLDIPKRKLAKRVETGDDDDFIRDSKKKGDTDRRSSRKETHDRDSYSKSARHAEDAYTDSSPTVTTPTLKRSGARRKSMSPVKNRDSRESTPTQFDATMSGALLNASARTSRNSSNTTQQTRPRISSSGKPLSTIDSIGNLPLSRDDPRKRSSPSAPDDATSLADSSALSRLSDGDSPRRNGPGLKRRGTRKHHDLMSVLSRDDAHTMVSRRSTRASRRETGPATVGDIMNELSAEELKYQRELRTLVDGVIPVLLQHVLSGSETSSRSRVFSNPPNDTKPIVDMGIALERLKTSHKRIPLHESNELLAWADGASKVYADYLRTWRLGFKDIVVNLAPAEKTSQNNGAPAWDDGLPRNKEGDLTDGAGERVDVAYLLKRPLVRTKYLAKAFKNVNQLQPSVRAGEMAARYQDLVIDAKKRVNDEQARLEDEAAANIDATRAREPRSLAPITGVTIDATRCVRARDYFDMDLVHSSGQQLGCKIEIIYRDDAPGRGKAGDILVCEVSPTGRWLLFPPLPTSLVSARKGDRPRQLVVMIRGFLANALQWREIMSLQADDDQTSEDWTRMLGSSPVPPRLNRRSSFNMFKTMRAPATEPEKPKATSVEAHGQLKDPSPREVEVPFGEQAKSSSRIWDGSEVNSVCGDDAPTTQLRRAISPRHQNTVSIPSMPDDGRRVSRDSATQPAYFYDQPRHDMHSDRPPKRPTISHTRSKSEWTGSTITTSSQGYSVWLPSEDRYSDEYSSDEEEQLVRRPSRRPTMHRRTSSVPSLDMPTVPKLRKTSPPSGRPESPSSDRDLLPSQKRAVREQPTEPSSAPAKLQKRRLSVLRPKQNEQVEPEPNKERNLVMEQQSPPHSKSRPMSLGFKSGLIPSFTPAFLKKDRRPSSPLKHQYEPSSASDSLSDSDLSDVDDFSSETSESDAGEADVSTIGDLKGFQEYNMRDLRPSPPPNSPPIVADDDASLRPSESTSQGPYRTVPPPSSAPATTVACIFSWSDRGSWDSLHPEECQIFVTPGLIEAFDLTQANSVPVSAPGDGTTPSSKGVRPLVALELTPLVPLRRGTAVDISVRSPPTENSLIRSSNNVMFRSRSPEECERLYALINRARIDSPTYIALQNARGPAQQSNWGELMERRNASRTTPGTSRSWWGLGSKRSNSYRSKGSRTVSVAATESSVGTMNTAFSALRRFSGSNRIFNIAKSTITSREGTRSTNSESLSSGAATPVHIDPHMGTPLGMANTKMRLYLRESASKWRDLGPGRLTVMLPPRPQPNGTANPRTTGMEKRILVYGKKGEMMLDATLGESAFERVARTGIAVSVYEEGDQVAAIGGVLIAKTTVYMIQMKSERDAAYTFGLVGKLRY